MITGAKTPEPNPPTSSLISIAKMASQIRMIIIVTKKTRILPPTVSSSPSRSSGFFCFLFFFSSFFAAFNCFLSKTSFSFCNSSCCFCSAIISSMPFSYIALSKLPGFCHPLMIGVTYKLINFFILCILHFLFKNFKRLLFQFLMRLSFHHDFIEF